MAIFTHLQSGLEGQLDGMGVAFASSLLGLAGSLVVGLLELFAGRGQNRFYGELEVWLSSITRVGFASMDAEGGITAPVLAAMMEQMSEQMDGMSRMYTETTEGQADVEARLIELINVTEKLTAKLDTGQTEALERVAASQEQIVARMQSSSNGEGLDTESRMRLRSIDVQLLRITDDLSKGRQQTVAELRSDVAGLARAISDLVKRGGSTGGGA